MKKLKKHRHRWEYTGDNCWDCGATEAYCQVKINKEYEGERCHAVKYMDGKNGSFIEE